MSKFIILLAMLLNEYQVGIRKVTYSLKIIKFTPTMKNPKSPSENPEQFVTIELELEPELVALIEALAAKRGMTVESFGAMVVDQYQARRN